MKRPLRLVISLRSDVGSNFQPDPLCSFCNPQTVIDEADLDTIRKLFTTIIRADRFNAGTYALMIDNATLNLFGKKCLRITTGG
ncbi:DUF6508 domain-containing protein [Paenibacillus sp. JMULE4]|uniref:DUF6508 domain-containing protein n=2 Tax=Paenibacillus TaxID=44249 RepID=UPI0035C8193E